MSAINRLEMRNISIAFGGFAALTEVDFTTDGGSVHALTGANGAGKSTLMAVLAGGRSVRRDALTAEARRLLGFERTGATLSAALDAAIDRLLASGTIGEGSDGYRIRG